MAIMPNDIGLATATDVGDVANLNTQSKTVVEAINEVLNNAGSAAADQIYVEGDGNSISGKGNIVFGNNNKIIGSGNVIVGDNLIIIGQDKKISAGLDDINFDSVNISTKTIQYYIFSENVTLNIAVGDKAAIQFSQTWYNSDWSDSVTVITDKYVTAITACGDGYFTVADIPVTENPPDETHTQLAMMYVPCFSLLKAEYKLQGESTIIMGNKSSESGSFSANSGNALAISAAAFNNAAARAVAAFACNTAQAGGKYGFAANSAQVFLDYGAALNNGFAYGEYSFAVGNGRAAGRPIKCTALSCSEKSFTAAAGESLAGLSAGNKLLIRYKNNGNVIINSVLTVKYISGQKIYVEESIGGGTYGEAIMPDGYIFRIETSYGNNFASGYGTAGNRYAQAHGQYTLAVHEGASIFGRYGVTPETYSWCLGNGTSFSAMGLAAKILQSGNMFIDGTYSSPCADYAEYFEWADGNPNNEDRVGCFVKLVNGKIDKATDFEGVLGITSGNPAILGDSGELHWNKKYISDDFGRIQYPDVVIPALTDKDGNVIEEERIERQPILNPDYDPTLDYIPRKDRPEWSAVGVMGKLPVRDDGTANVGDVVRPTEGGIATKSINNGYPVIKRISDNVILVWVR